MPSPVVVGIALAAVYLFGRRRRRLPPVRVDVRPEAGVLGYVPIIYGKRLVRGAPVYVTGSNNGAYLWGVWALAHGPIEDVDEIYVDGNLAVQASGTLRAVAAVAQITAVVAGNPYSMSTAAAHDFVAGDTVRIAGISGASPDPNGDWTVLSVASNTAFTIPLNVITSGTVAGGTTATRLTPGYANYLSFAKYLGSTGQNTTTAPGSADGPTADSTLTASSLTSAFPEWTSAHRGGGVAYVLLRMVLNTNLYSGLPTVEAVVRGRKVYDPSAGTTAYSFNPALCVRDWLTNTAYGYALASLQVDDSTAFGGIQSAATHCAAVVYAPAGTGQVTITAQSVSSTYTIGTSRAHALASGNDIWIQNHSASVNGQYTVATVVNATTFTIATTIAATGTGGSVQKLTTQSRFECHAVLDPADGLRQNLDVLLSACRGNLTWAGGLARLWIRQARTAETFELTEDNIVGFRFVVPGADDLLNALRIEFPNAAKVWQADSFDFPLSTASNTYLTADASVVLTRELSLPATTNRYTAEQIGLVLLEEARQQLWVEIAAHESAMQLAVGDVVNVNHSTPGWTDKQFWVIGAGLNPDNTVALTLMEYESTAYDAEMTDDEDTASDTALPPPWHVSAPTSLTASVAVTDAFLSVSWTAAADSRVLSYDCLVSSDVFSGVVNATPGLPDSCTARFGPCQPGGTYTVSVRSRTGSGLTSAFVTAVAVAPTAAGQVAMSLTRTAGADYVTVRADVLPLCQHVRMHAIEHASSGGTNPPTFLPGYIRHEQTRPASGVLYADITVTAGNYLRYQVIGSNFGIPIYDSGVFETQAVATGTAPAAAPTSLVVTTSGVEYVTLGWTNGDDLSGTVTRLYDGGAIVGVATTSAVTATITNLMPGSAHQFAIDHFRNGQRSAQATLGASSSGLAAAATSFAVASCGTYMLGPFTMVSREFAWAGGGGGAWEIYESYVNTAGTGGVAASGASGTTGTIEHPDTDGGTNYYYFHRYTSPVSDWLALTGNPLDWGSC